MIVEEIEMVFRQAVDLGQRIIDPLRVKALATLKKRVFVTEVAMMRASARHNYGIRHQIVVALDEVATNGWNTLQSSAFRRCVDVLRYSRAKVLQELQKGLLTGPEEDGVSMSRGLIWERSDVQPAETDKCT